MSERQRGVQSSRRSISPATARPIHGRPSSGLRSSFAAEKHVQIELPHNAPPPQRVQLRDRLRQPRPLGQSLTNATSGFQGASKFVSRVSPPVKPVARVPTFAPHLRVENHLIKANIADLWNPKISRWSHPTPAPTVVSNNVANCLLASQKLLIKETARTGLLIKETTRPKSPVGPLPKSPVRPKSPVEARRGSVSHPPSRPGSALVLTPTNAKEVLKSAEVFAKASAGDAQSAWKGLSPLYQNNLLHFNELLDDCGEMHGTGEEFLEGRTLLTRGRIRPKSGHARSTPAGRERPSSAIERFSKDQNMTVDSMSKRPMSAHTGRSSRQWNEMDVNSSSANGNFGGQFGASGRLQLRDLSFETKRSESVPSSREDSDSDVGAISPLQPRSALIEHDDWGASSPVSQRRSPLSSPLDASGFASGHIDVQTSPLASPKVQKRVSMSEVASPRQEDGTVSTNPSTFASGFVSVADDGSSLPQTTSEAFLTSRTLSPPRTGVVDTLSTRSTRPRAGGEKKEKKKKSEESPMHKELQLRKQHWRHVTEALKELSHAIEAGLVNTAQDMRSYVVRYAKEESIQENSMIGLHKALTLAEAPWTEHDFFSRILPTIIDRALAMTGFFPNGRLPNMKRKAEGRMVISRAQTASVLANMFLCSLPSNDFSLGAVHTSHQGYQIAKIHFFINYFDRISHLSTNEPPGNIEVYKSLHDSHLDWLRCRRPLLPLTVNFGRAVDEEKTLQVMPSHSNIGGGMLYRGRGEEEIRILLYPEVCIAMFVCGVIDDNESVLVRGAERFSAFEDDDGFSLKFSGSYKDKSERDADATLKSNILLVDASKWERTTELAEQLEVANMDRDLNKILRGFTDEADSSSPGPITTTNWGCDRRFNGARDVRPLIQWMAASVAGRELHLWLVEDRDHSTLRRQLEQLSDLCVKNAVDVGQLLQGCREVGESYRKEGTLIPMVLKSLMLGDDSGSDSEGPASPLFASSRAPCVVTSGKVEQLVTPLVPLTRERVFTESTRAAGRNSTLSSSSGLPHTSDMREEGGDTQE